MANRWGAPVLAAGLVALAAGPSASGAYFGVSNYAADAPPSSCAQTHFVTAKSAIDVVPAHGGTDVEAAGLMVPFASGGGPAGNGRTPPDDDGTLLAMAGSSPQAYELVPKTITETVYRPITETVMKDCRKVVFEKVCETQYKEFTVTRHQRVCEQETTAQCFQVCKPICETVYREETRTVCKPVCETHYKECTRPVCKQVSESAVRETARLVCREVTETVNKPVCRRVTETVTSVRTVERKVPETVCVTERVHGRLVWEEVPRYECAFDPCTCSTCQKQVGTRKKLVHEPAHEVTRQVTRCKTVCEQVPETKVVSRVVVEQVPTTVVKKVSTVVYDRVPVTVIRTIKTTEKVMTPYTVTKMVQTTETTRVPVVVRRKLQGAYVDVAALSPQCAAQFAKGREYVAGGASALCNARCPTYDTAGPSRCFVEGLHGTKVVTRSVSKVVPVTEVQRVPCQVTRAVPREVVCKVPVKETRMVPTTVTRVVQVRVCRQACACPSPCREVVVKCPPVVVNCPPAGPACGCGPCSCKTSGGWLRGLLDNPCRQHPVRDFFHRILSARVHCTPCKAGPCGSCDPCTTGTPAAQPLAPVPAATEAPSTPPRILPPSTLPPSSY